MVHPQHPTALTSQSPITLCDQTGVGEYLVDKSAGIDVDRLRSPYSLVSDLGR